MGDGTGPPRPPPELPERVFETLFDLAMTENMDNTDLMARSYFKDKNGNPPVYVLQVWQLLILLLKFCLRLHQPVKNPISDNSNILWNSPSLGINSRYRLP